MVHEATAILDIGTNTIRVVVGELRDDGEVSVIGIGETPSRGIRKGEVVNRDDAIACVRKAIKAAEENLHKSLHSVFLVTSAGETRIKKSTGVCRLVDPIDNRKMEISAGDVADVLENARQVALPESRIKLHTLQQYFEVDDGAGITDPIGLTGEELRVDMLTIHGKRSAVEHFRKIVDDAPIECSDAVFSGLCSALAVVRDEQKKAGVLVIDLGGGTTDFVVYHEGYIQAAGSFAVGGNHINNDISVGLQVPLRAAEAVKIKEGSALTNSMERDHNISIPSTTQGFGGKTVRVVTLNAIINARMDEIFSLVKEEVDRQCPNVPLSAGVLLTGGGAFLNGARDLGQKVFNVSCAYGKPIDVHGLPSSSTAPLYACHVGALRYAASLHKPVKQVTWKQKIIKLLWGDAHE